MSGLFGKAALVPVILALAACGGGGGGNPSSGAGASGPTAVIQGNTSAVVGTGTWLQAGVGSQVNLSGLGSTDADSTISSYTWTLVSKPAGSTLALASPNAANIGFIPDVTGNYVLTLAVTDAMGLSAAEGVTVAVTNAVPVTNVVDSVVFSGASTTNPAESISVGNVVTLDASASTDPGNLPIDISWLMLQQPDGSTASLAISGATAHFSPDIVGEYRVRVRATDTTGAYSDVIYVYDVSNTAPTAIVAASAVSVGHSGSINAATGYQVILNGGSSLIPPGDTATQTWTMVSKPAGSSSAQLSATSGNTVSFVPDVVGNYVVSLLVSDTTSGYSSTYTMTVQVAQAPTAVVTGSAAPVALASAPSFVSSTGVPVILRGSGSYDLSGSSLTYAWSLVSKPARSTAAITSPGLQDISFTPDLNGAYIIRLDVSSADGYSSSQTVTINVGDYPPVAVVAQSQLATLLGGTVTDSAANSYSPTGKTLSYSWSVDSRPAGSVAVIASPNAATLSFTPDVAGTYSVSVTVDDGSISSVAIVTITALSASPGTVPLAYKPLLTRFSKGLGKAVIISTNPNTLHIVDPVAATDVGVALPAAVKSFSISPDGKLAAVLHEGVVSLVDLSTATLVHSSSTSGSQTDAFVSNDGKIYVVGQTGGQWVTPGFTELDGTTGAVLQTSTAGDVYGTTVGIFSDVNNKIYVLSEGLSPAQIYAVGRDPATGNLTTTTGSPYWGNYPMAAPFWLSGDQSLLFTAAGDYFKASDLTYQGTFGLTGSVLSMSHSSTAQEAVVLVNNGGYAYSQPSAYPSVYKRYTGSLLFPASDVALPLIGAAQSYGLAIFHASDDSHVMVVQTGSATPNATGLNYFLIDR